MNPLQQSHADFVFNVPELVDHLISQNLTDRSLAELNQVTRAIIHAEKDKILTNLKQDHDIAPLILGMEMAYLEEHPDASAFEVVDDIAKKLFDMLPKEEALRHEQLKKFHLPSLSAATMIVKLKEAADSFVFFEVIRQTLKIQDGCNSVEEIREWFQKPENQDKIKGVKLLKLSGYNLTHLPKEISHFTNLKNLILDNNMLTTLPQELRSLGNLQTLDLSDNCFSDFPLPLSRCGSLRCLALDDNEISKIPPEIDQLNELIKLSMKNNQLAELPAALWRIESLQCVYFNGNPIQKIDPGHEHIRTLKI